MPVARETKTTAAGSERAGGEAWGARPERVWGGSCLWWDLIPSRRGAEGAGVPNPWPASPAETRRLGPYQTRIRCLTLDVMVPQDPTGCPPAQTLDAARARLRPGSLPVSRQTRAQGHPLPRSWRGGRWELWFPQIFHPQVNCGDEMAGIVKNSRPPGSLGPGPADGILA